MITKKIGIFTEDFDHVKTSAGQHMVDLVMELSKFKVELEIFTLTNRNKSKLNEIKYPDNIKIHRLPYAKNRDSSLIRRAVSEFLISFRVLLYLIRENKLNSFNNLLWYSPTIFWGPIAFFYKVFKKTKNILIIRDIFPLWAVDLKIIKNKSLVYYFFRFFELVQYKYADVIAIQTEGNKEFYKYSLKISSKLTVLRTWYYLTDSIDEITEKQKKQIPFDSNKICTYVGNLGVAQNQSFLIDMINELKDEYHFLFIGLKDSDRKLIKDKVKSNNLKNITLLPPLSKNEINPIISNSHLGIFSLDQRHTSHNIPGKFLHYISLGLPVFGLTNKNNDINLIINNNYLGGTYSGINPSEAAKSFRYLSNQITKKEFKKETIQKYVKDNLCPSKAAKKILSYCV
ncbi:glycosyltransferase family 4 protein [Gammaproteobacteria bacterium]|nr:glycosyltransferase family 4 protein [Gammaproteobacteria bacterium]MDA9575295.1 glycosyltransferase family 4 protein [Gammaproteobacteria bacterium]MDC3411147.1 glycosyltransferase family 4 protein [Gammaproteobacteria bacterium]